MRNVTEIPNRWVVVKITRADNEPHYKVFGSWSGGYLDGDRWKMNSGISRVEEDETNLYFHGHSGSCYQCNKKSYGIATAYSLGVLDNLKNVSVDNGVEIEVLSEDTDFLNLKY